MWKNDITPARGPKSMGGRKAVEIEATAATGTVIDPLDIIGSAAGTCFVRSSNAMSADQDLIQDI
jgi:hypothetical protein